MDNQMCVSPYPGNPFVTYKYFSTHPYVSVYAFPEAVKLIAEAAGSEREDELFYDYLLSVAPAAQKDIIVSIRDDERKHNLLFKQLYWELTGRDLQPVPEEPFTQPKSYCDGLTRAIFGELGAVEKYRKILFGLEFLPYRNIITEIYTDELKHASKWNYLYTLNAVKER
jgi:rubrerythrin